MNIPVVYLGGDAEFVRTLAERYRVLTPSPHDFAEVDEPAHVVADADASAIACLLAIRQPELVQSLVLLRPTFDNADLVERLSEIRVPTLVLCGASDEPDPGRLVVQRVPDSYRLLVYGPSAVCDRFAELAIDFIERGDRFVVADSAAGSGR